MDRNSTEEVNNFGVNSNKKYSKEDANNDKQMSVNNVKQPPLLVPPNYLDTIRATELLSVTQIDPDELEPNDPRLGFYAVEAEEEIESGKEPELKDAPDGGWGWLVVLAAFLNGLVLDGISYSWGVFLPVLMEEFNTSEAKTAMIGSLCCGCYLAISPVAAGATNRFGCRKVSIVGCLCAGTSIVIASFAPTINLLILLLGVSTGLAFGFLYLPSLVIVGLWFEKKRGVAMGITMAGSGVGMFVVPPLCNLMIDVWGWRNSMYGLATMVFACAPLAILYRPVPSTYKNGQNMKKTKISKSRKVALIDKEMKIGLPENQGSNSVGNLDDSSSFSESFTDEPNSIAVPTIRQTSFEKRGSSQSVEQAATSSKSKNSKAPNLLKKAVLNRKKASMCQSMTAVHENQESCGSLKPQCARTLEDLTDRTLEHSEFGENSRSNQRKTSAFVSVFVSECSPTAEVRSRARPSNVSHLSVSAAEPLRKKDIFYSRSTINLSKEGLNTNATTEQVIASGSGTTNDNVPAENEEDEKLHKVMHKNKFLNGLISMLGVDIFKDACYDLLMVSGIIGFLGFFAPFSFLTAFAQNNQIDSSSAAFLISLIGIANTFGRPLFGMLVSLKILDSVRVLNWTIIVAGLCTMALPFLQSYWAIAAYCVIFGLSIAGHVCMKSLALVQLMGLDALTNGLGFVLLSNGVSAMLGGPFLGLFYNEENESFLLVFILAGVMLMVGGILGLPLQTISNRIKRRKMASKTQIVNVPKQPGTATTTNGIVINDATETHNNQLEV